jgi:uncharacterized membrane protein YccC
MTGKPRAPRGGKQGTTQRGRNKGQRTRPTQSNAEWTLKDREAVRLRAAGMTFDQIAERLGYADRSGAHRAVTHALQRALREPADELRELENRRLDELLQTLWLKAMAGDLKAIDRVQRIIETRMRLNGLQAPLQVPKDNVDEAVSTIDEISDALSKVAGVLRRPASDPGDVDGA